MWWLCPQVQLKITHEGSESNVGGLYNYTCQIVDRGNDIDVVVAPPRGTTSIVALPGGMTSIVTICAPGKTSAIADNIEDR